MTIVSYTHLYQLNVAPPTSMLQGLDDEEWLGHAMPTKIACLGKIALRYIFRVKRCITWCSQPTVSIQVGTSR